MKNHVNVDIEQRIEGKPRISPDVRLGSVHLAVSDLERSLAFYQDSLGLQLHRGESDTAYLGAGRDDLLVLTERSSGPRVRGTSGLYHFALLVPSRLTLAQSLKNLIETETRLQGFADHLVSEAIYLADPDGNGIEIYRDRPRSAWQYRDGILVMDTLPLDYQGMLAELENDGGPWEGMQPETIVGHMHLHVGDIARAQAFYTHALGFDLVLNIGSAAFVSAGGYHHHIAFNTWNGGAPPPPNALGLQYFTIQMPGEDEVEVLAERLRKAGVFFKRKEKSLFVRDPSLNGILVSSDATLPDAGQ